jgi:hypothetical protein
MMRRVLILVTLLTTACSTNKITTADKNFSDLNQDEKTQLFGHFSDELKGDFLVYSGVAQIENKTGFKMPDSTTFTELVMDSDKRFVIRTRFVQHEMKNDSMKLFVMGGQSNKGMGNWKDLGDKFELKFKIGTVDSYFEDENNKDKIITVDRYTMQISKTVDELWIWRTLCKKSE